MPDEKKSYDMLLEKMDAQDKKISDLEAELKDMKDFNRALLARTPSPKNPNQPDVNDKFEKYLKGE